MLMTWVLFIRPDERSLLAVKTALNIFGGASGLLANLEKSVVTPIHCSDQQLDLVLATLECRAEAFLCRYLEVPLSVFKLKRSATR
jgi:hypothetical protein